MASVKLQGNASGTGSLTVQAPNTNSNLTLGLPASNGTLVTTGDTGTVTTTMLAATGTPSSSTFLRGDGTWNAPGGVTSAVAGNGIAVSGATGAVTFSAAAPSFNSVGSYVWAKIQNNSATTITSGNNYATGTADLQIMSAVGWPSGSIYTAVNNLSGTWKYMGATVTPSGCINQLSALFVRVS